MHQICKLVAVDPHDPAKGATFESAETDVPTIEEQIEADKRYGKLTVHGGELWYKILQHDVELTTGEARLGVNAAFLEWETGIAVDFKSVPIDITSDFQIYFRSSEEDELFKREPNVLAYMHYPFSTQSGLCVFNSDYAWTFNGAAKSGKWMKEHGIQVQNEDGMYQTWSVFKVMRHELGHGIGLPHSKLSNQTMSSSYGRMAQHNTPRDNLRGQAKYGVSTRSQRWRTVIKRWLLNKFKIS